MPKLLYKLNKGRIAFVRCCVVFFLAIVPGVIGTPEVYAAAIDVPCDVSALIDAIETANGDTAPDTLELASECVYTLTAVDNSTPHANGLPVVLADLTINGNDATIERSSAEDTLLFGILQIESGVNVHINNLTLQNGHGSAGGAITNRGHLTLDHARLLNNVTVPGLDLSTGGGAILHREGTLTITNSTLNNNRQLGTGYHGAGGGAVSSEAAMTIAHSQFDGNFSENTAPFSWNGGGAIYNAGGNVTIDESTFSNNSSYSGGAITNVGELLVTESTFTSNVGSGWIQAGAISNTGTLTIKNDVFTLNSGGVIGSVSHLTIVGSTFSNNTGSALTLLGTTEIHDSQFTGNTAENGAAIVNYAILSVSDSEFVQNAAVGYGGGIENGENGKLDLTRCAFSDNSAAWGGGLLNVGQAVISESEFMNNQATVYGGGLVNWKGKMKIKRSTFEENHADRGGGIAGINAKNYSSTLAIIKTTAENNSARWGGGVFQSGGEVKLNNSTIAYNHAVGDDGLGGGLYLSGKSKIGNTTIAQNTAGKSGGGIFNSAETTLFNVTLYQNHAEKGGALYQNSKWSRLINTLLANSIGAKNCKIDEGSVVDGGHNLNTDTSCGIGPATKILFDKMGLQDNGGPTKTIGLRPNSPAVDAGDDAVCAAAPVKARDQRGVVRPQGAHCDIGAYELKK